VSDPRSNLGFESEDQLRAFVKALSNSAIPGKFAYVGEAAAATYNAHALTKEYGQVTRSVVDESSLLLEVWGRELGRIRTLADVGPGNGLHSADLLQRLAATANWSPSNYLAIDYSLHMAEIAKQNIERLTPEMYINSIPFDIESTFRQTSSQLPDASESIYFLLGNTIGNVESMSRAIEGIRSLAGHGARLLIGCALFDEYRSAESYLKPYRMKTYVDCVLCPLMMIGVPRHSLESAAELSPDTRTVSTLVVFREDFQADILGERVTVKAASTIRCALSRRFLPGEIPNLLKRWNVSTLGMAEDLQNGHGTYCAII
jgi:Histidine-specific methyltransferase, SAM-dependent